MTRDNDGATGWTLSVGSLAGCVAAALGAAVVPAVAIAGIAALAAAAIASSDRKG